ncbi:extensin-like [Gigantopelta aegis]|uniref:extensin-like n=1 Tax=Gigantopelta aegis TaxID=1735272 RepID=UPI001B889148|nr:extensin-like [Gigantopelta aegis]
MEEVPAPAVSATVPLEDDELDEPDAAICVTPSNRPPTPSPTQAPPDVSPTPPTTPVEAQARKEPVVKRRKANTPPSSTPPKPTRPSKPPQPRTEPEGWWVTAGRPSPTALPAAGEDEPLRFSELAAEREDQQKKESAYKRCDYFTFRRADWRTGR